MNSYIVHNGFGIMVSILSEEFREGDIVIIANKNAELLAAEYSDVFGRNTFITFSGPLPGLEVVNSILSATNLYISSARHKRMAMLWPIIYFSRKKNVCIIDEGVATINKDFHKALTNSQPKITNIITSLFLSGFKGLELKTIFGKEFVSESFLKSCNIKLVTKNELNVGRVPFCAKAFRDSQEQANELIVLGSAEVAAEDLANALSKEDKEHIIVKAKDHPLRGNRNDLSLSPEIYVLKNNSEIFSVIGSGSSALIIIKKLFPRMRVINAVVNNSQSAIDLYMSHQGVSTWQVDGNMFGKKNNDQNSENASC